MGPPERAASSKPQQAANVEKAGSGAEDTRVDPSQKPYVRAALASEEVDQQAVAEAARLLQSGQLDTPDAARRAARAMLDLGI